MSIDNIRKLKAEAGIPKPKKYYQIPKVSKKRQKKMAEQKVTFEQDKEFYFQIWLACPHWCIECGKKLGKEPLTLFFHHLLEKRNYPQFRHTPENIAVLCPDCHQQAETDLDKVPKVKEMRIRAEKTLLNDTQ